MSDIRRLKKFEGKIREHYLAATQAQQDQTNAVAAERDALKSHVENLTAAQADLMAENLTLRAELASLKAAKRRDDEAEEDLQAFSSNMKTLHSAREAKKSFFKDGIVIVSDRG